MSGLGKSIMKQVRWGAIWVALEEILIEQNAKWDTRLTGYNPVLIGLDVPGRFSSPKGRDWTVGLRPVPRGLEAI